MLTTIPRRFLTPKRARKPDPEGQNDKRAEWAEEALLAFMHETGTDQEDAVSDLLCDIMHYCDRDNRLNFEHQLTRARGHYVVETGEVKDI